MKPFALAAAAAGAVVALAACSHSAAPSASPSSSATGTRAAATHSAGTHPAAVVSCPQKYDAWKHGPGKKVDAALKAVGSGSTAEAVSALKEAGPAIASAARNPIPACADPKGYWTVLLMHVNAAAGSTSTASERASITLALKGIPKLEDELNAELKDTTGA